VRGPAEPAATVAVETILGPLDDERMAWISRLYGSSDAKYASPEFVRHLFAGNPFGWSLHAFLLSEGKPVGHCGMIPVRARDSTGTVVSGKYEAFAVDERYRSATTQEGLPAALGLLAALDGAARESEISIVHGITSRELGLLLRLLGSRAIKIPLPTYVAVGSRAEFARGLPRDRRWAVAVLSLAQHGLAASARTLGRLGLSPPGMLRECTPEDASLADVPISSGSWTITASDSWEWLAGTGLLRTMEVRGRFGSRALVRLPAHAREDLQILAWSRRRPGLISAVLMLASAVQLRRDARAVRVQPWQDATDSRDVVRACRLLGFVRAHATTTLYVRTFGRDGTRPVLTPFFYATF
jgi:hypothetical protein